MNLTKLAKNRTILRRVDTNIVRHSMYIAFTYAAIFITVATTGGFYRDLPLICVGFGIFQFFLTAVIVYSFLRFDHLHGKGPDSWRKRYVMLNWMFKAHWGLLAALIITYYGISTPSFLVILISVATGAIDNVEWAPYHRANAISKSLLYLPLLFSLLLMPGMEAFMVAAIVMVVYALLLSQSRWLSNRFWEMEKNRYDLQVQARDLAHAVQSVESADQFKAEFLTNVTREIRTPMNNILGMLALMDDAGLNDQQQPLHQVAVNSGDSLLKMVDEVMDYSKLVAGTIRFNDSVVSLRRCLNQAMELLGPVAHGRGIEISVWYEPDIPVRIKGDRERIVQVVTNLLSNAIQHCDGSELLLRVTLSRTTEEGGMLRVEVVDRETVLSDQDYQCLHTLFTQQYLGDVDSNKTGGLGIAIARGVTEALQGGIGFDVDSGGIGVRYWGRMHVGVSTQQAQVNTQIKVLVDSYALVIGAPEGMQESLSSELYDQGIQAVAVSDLEGGLEVLEAAVDDDEKVFLLALVNCPIRAKVDLQEFEIMLQRYAHYEARVVVMSSLSLRTEWLSNDNASMAEVEWITKPVSSVALVHVLHKLFDSVPLLGSNTNQEPGTFSEHASQCVLLVEDNPVNQMVAQGMLQKIGLVVTIASDGEQALKVLAERNFDLILMDCQMPNMDGYEATQQIRELEQNNELDRNVPIIAMTASVIDGEKSRCFSAGMDDYIAKPINLDDLSAKLRFWLDERRGKPSFPETIKTTLQNSRESQHNQESQRQSQQRRA